ncbi:SigE family RNA polymerase sigma factor [Streptodolium elevatio]|uniref:SigE family RNA polymerase sigma factor n=1 Tax=Streptodolium elevatio TaxID=3157996 RepID=A0ABV3DM81_9ACTN
MGDRRESVAEFVAVRGRALMRYAYLLSGDAAEDLVQEALVRALARRRQVPEDPRKLEVYVRRIMVNLVIDRSRRAARWHRALPRLVTASDVRDASGEVCERVTLAASLALLPPRQRACVVMHYYEDLPLVEIAERLGCGIGTVKSQLHDARRALAETWGDARPKSVEATGDPA